MIGDSDADLFQLVKDSVPESVSSRSAERLRMAFPSVQPRRPGSWTSLEAAALWGVSRATASARCRKLVADKKAGVDTIVVSGRSTQVYYWLEEWEVENACK